MGVVTRNLPSFSSANCHSRGWSEKLLRTSKLISGFKVQPSALFRRPVKLTWSAFSRTPTCAQFTPSVLPLCQRISSWHGGSVERGLKKPTEIQQQNITLHHCVSLVYIHTSTLIYYSSIVF